MVLSNFKPKIQDKVVFAIPYRGEYNEVRCGGVEMNERMMQVTSTKVLGHGRQSWGVGGTRPPQFLEWGGGRI